MKSVNQTYHITASLAEVWQALIDPKHIKKWSGDSVKMNDKVGTKFSLWGGSVWGKNIEVIPKKKLVQEWYSKENKKWEKPSIATFSLHKEDKGTRVDLLHIDVPDEYASDIANGWKEYYLSPLKSYVEKED